MSATRLPAAPMRILVRGVNWLGDAVMTTPALLQLRAAHPHSHITILTHEKLADLWTHHPAINEVITFNAADNFWNISRRLAAKHFDIALVFPNSTRSALEVALARIPHRIGYAGDGRSWLLTHAVQPRAETVNMHKRSVAEIHRCIANAAPTQNTDLIPSRAHHIHQYLHLVATENFASAEALEPMIAVTADEVEATRRKFLNATSNDWFLGLNPGAEYGPAKRWPVENFISLGRETLKRPSSCVVIFGGNNDVAVAKTITTTLANEIGPATRIINLAGRTTLRELCAALKLLRVLVTNDSGPMHVAAAVGTPVVVPFGSTSPELTGPGLPGSGLHQLLKSNAPCSPCFLRECPIDFRCLKDIGWNAVHNAVQRVEK